MSKTKVAKTQHYVPQFILENFSFGGKSQIWVFDKKTDQRFKTNIKNIASENGFYNFLFKNIGLTVDPSFSNLETRASKIIDTIVKTKSIANLKEEDRIMLSYFFALQFTRTKQQREIFKHMTDDLLKAIKSRGWDPKEIKGYKELTEDELRLQSIKIIMNSDKFAPHFFNKSWILFESKKDEPLYISDNPITLQNMHTFGPYGNIGLAVKGIEIYFPLSKNLALGMYCPSIEKELCESYGKYKIIRKINPLMATQVIKDPMAMETMEQMVEGFESKKTVQFNPSNVMNHNSLQVEYSYRFVYSCTNDFSLVEQMIKDNQKFREGLKPQMLT